ncbi:MAG: 30S ribosomal protein S19e [Thermoplasmata archaeon]|nr:MAG: 30S ribosomal protein S19e [Thermoplasmata archaeon]
MTTVYDVDPGELIEEVAKELRKLGAVSPPEWSKFVKTGGDREKAPDREDWWYVRSASVLRKLRVHGPLGVERLRKLYGGKKNMGCSPERKAKGSGAIIRRILHQLEEAGLVKKTPKGREVTPKGISLLDKVAHRMLSGGE